MIAENGGHPVAGLRTRGGGKRRYQIKVDMRQELTGLGPVFVFDN